MTHFQSKKLYEEIMAEVAVAVKKIINESYESGALKKFIAFAQSLAKKDNKDYEIHFICNGKDYDVINVRYDGTLYDGIHRNCLSGLTDDNIYGNRFYVRDDLSKVLKGKEPTWKSLKQSTAGRKVSCLALVDWNEVRKNDAADALAAVFVEEKGTAQIFAAVHKSSDRRKQKEIKMETDPKKWTAAEWKDVFSNIKDDYAKFKKEKGDKAALELSETVNRMSANETVLVAMSRLFGYKIEKMQAVRFLYVFLLDGRHYGWLDPMFKDKRFVELYKKYNPDKEI